MSITPQTRTIKNMGRCHTDVENLPELSHVCGLSPSEIIKEFSRIVEGSGFYNSSTGVGGFSGEYTNAEVEELWQTILQNHEN